MGWLNSIKRPVFDVLVNSWRSDSGLDKETIEQDLYAWGDDDPPSHCELLYLSYSVYICPDDNVLATAVCKTSFMPALLYLIPVYRIRDKLIEIKRRLALRISMRCLLFGLSLISSSKFQRFYISRDTLY